ncbi:ImuA family protein [Methylorubrum salsuginis]|uniref:ImuA family protein n=1 Tax=Methylorubrum salsuginis TaxID=414703 RepID=UPI000B8642B4|nr:damage-inducible mutagenesis protein [Methylorubrum salsuginis]
MLAELRRLAEPTPRTDRAVLPFGAPGLDQALPGGGLALGALHQIHEGGPRGRYAASAVLFAGGILARLDGPVLWCLHSRDLFAPALARVGLHPDRVVYCETWRDAEVLPAMEEGLRHRGLAGVVGELTRMGLTPSRRLQLAAEGSGVTAFVLHRVCGGEAAEPEPSAARTRWRVSPAPSDMDTNRHLGRPRWRLDLQRCRGGAPGSWIVEACDAQGRLAVPRLLANRPAAPERALRRAAFR